MTQGAKKRKQPTIESFFFSKKTAKNAETTDTKKVEDTKVVVGESADIKKIEEKSVTQESSPTFPRVQSKVKEIFTQTVKDKKVLDLLKLELETLDDSWFAHLTQEFTKPYFLNLKKFVLSEQNTQTVFPPSKDVYSWSRLTPFSKVKVVIIGQDPYHNFNQAHGLAFSVKSPTPAPPSLKNIYKELKTNYSDFQIDNKIGDLTHWSTQGVLLLNTALTVRAHNANSHSKHGWEIFTSKVVETLIKDREQNGQNIVFLLWGNNAIKLVENLLSQTTKSTNISWKDYKNLLVLKSTHPSPLSASRGFFGNLHFRKINDWLYNKGEKLIDWSVLPGAALKEVKDKNMELEAILEDELNDEDDKIEKDLKEEQIA